MNTFNKIFPTTANNDYKGSPIAFFVLCAFGLMFIFRSLVHYIKDDGGANSIASLIVFAGDPDPNLIIYRMFSLWGTQQLITVAILGVVLWRYRTLIPFMYLMIIAEQILRMSVGWIYPTTAEYYAHTPPGAVTNLPLMLLAIVMLVLSLRESKKKPSACP